MKPKLILRHSVLGSFILALVGTLLLTNCEPAFSPLKENNRYYSVFGFLNASADTQFIRIEKLRDSLFLDAPEKLNAEVMLTNVTTGQTRQMQDSVFEYVGDGGTAHNYYTTLEINPTETYRLEIISEDKITSAQVDVPADFPEPVLLDRKTIKITGINRLIAVNAIYYATRICGEPYCQDFEYGVRSFSYPHLKDTVRMANGDIQAPINTQADLEKVALNFGAQYGFELHKIEAVIAAGTPNWPNFLELDAEEAAIPNVASNIKGGVGLLGGVVTDTVNIPFESLKKTDDGL